MENDQQKLLFLHVYKLSLCFIQQTFRGVEFTILIQRTGVKSFNVQSEVVKDSHRLSYSSNCKIICSDYFLDYIAVTLKSS